MLPFISNDLPTNIGRAALHALAYLVFQLPGFTSLAITDKNRELLPHVFNLTCVNGLALRHQPNPIGGVLSAALSVFRFYIGTLPVRKRDALCCPDFPLRNEFAAIERLAFCFKDTKKGILL